MPDSRHDMTDRSVVSLLKDLSSEALGLVHEEILLARSEISRKVSLFQRSAPMVRPPATKRLVDDARGRTRPKHTNVHTGTNEET